MKKQITVTWPPKYPWIMAAIGMLVIGNLILLELHSWDGDARVLPWFLWFVQFAGTGAFISIKALDEYHTVRKEAESQRFRRGQ